MDLSTVYSAKAVALNHTEVASNKIPYLGLAFFPEDKKMGLDLKWIKTHKGLPVSLSPSNFDAKSTIRTRKGFTFDKQQMAFFRETMFVTEEDEQEIMRVQEATDPYAMEVLRHIYDDVNTLIDGANVVSERMRMALLFPSSGGPSISIASNGVTYAYTYDTDGSWATSNRVDLSGARLWANRTTAKPLTDIADIKKKAAKKGTTLKYMVMNSDTLTLLVDNDQVKGAILSQNSTANIFMDEDLVKAFLEKKFTMKVIVYDKQVKKEDGTDLTLCPTGLIGFIPEGPLGKTWFGVTPEERTLMGKADAEVAIVGKGIAVTYINKYGPPVENSTTVSMIVLPSFERMDEYFLLDVGTAEDEGDENDALTVTVAEGTASGTTKFTVTEELGTGHSYKVKAYASGATLPNYGQNLKLWTAYTEGTDFATTDGYEVVIAEVDAEYKCVAAVKVVADVKA